MNKKIELKRTILKAVNIFIGFTGFEIVRRKTSKASGYIPVYEVLSAAGELDLSVCDYLERIWGKEGDTERVVAKMGKYGICSDNLKYICEIGSGSGRYLEKIINLCNPVLYESYEIEKDWADFLERKYSVVSHDADGRSLRYTKSSSVDLVHAHGLFVYIPFLTT